MPTIAETFIKEAIKTESVNFVEIAKRLSEPRTIRLLHAAMGLSTEANEFLDAMKKYIFYGKELDLINIKEEIGDSNWYQAVALDELNATFEEVMVMIIKKLQKRYGTKGFNAEGALVRNLTAERTILESEYVGKDYATIDALLTEELTKKMELMEHSEPITIDIEAPTKIELEDDTVHLQDETGKGICGATGNITKQTDGITCEECSNLLAGAK